MRKQFINPFHNTSITLDVTDGSHLTEKQIKRLEQVLCGMQDCQCNFYPVQSEDGHWKIYKGGEVLADEASKAAAALGSIRSEAKTAASRANGRKGGRPCKSK